MARITSGGLHADTTIQARLLATLDLGEFLDRSAAVLAACDAAAVTPRRGAHLLPA